MISKESENRPMWIAPCRYPEKRYWTAEDWKALDLENEGDWQTAVEIFEDRIRYRYLDAIEELQRSDNAFYNLRAQRRFGFSMMALDCLLIETLAQFYKGIPESPRKKNRDFYKDFLFKDSFVMKKYFDQTLKAEVFYDTIRCGILHQAETKEESTIWYRNQGHSVEPFIFSEDGKSMRVYWFNFHKIVKEEFDAYCVCLRTNQPPDYRGNFKKKMDNICRVTP